MAGKRIVVPNYMPALDLTGGPVAGAKLYFYENNTTTLKAIYTSSALSVAHPNPVVANAAGVFPSIFADEAEVFSVAITDASDSPISGLRNRDNVKPSLVYGQEAAESAEDTVFTPAGTGAAIRSLQDVLRETVRLNDFTGADPTGTANSYAALVAAIAATPEGGTLELNGFYRISTGITITKSMTIKGPDHRIGNVTDGADTRGMLYFDTNVADGILVNGAVLTLDGVIVAGITLPTSTGNGIRTTGANNSLILTGESVVQGFQKGVVLSGGFYNRLLNTSVVFCQTAIEADNVYNLTISQCQLRPEGAGSRVIVLTNGSQASFEQCSLESFQEYGILLLTGSGCRTRDCYFESDPNTTTAWNVFISDNCSYEEEGNQIYMTCAKHVSVEGSATNNYRIISRNNYFQPEATARRVDYYSFNPEYAGALVEITGNIYAPGAAIGATNNWLNADYVFSYTFAAGRGSYRVDFPPGHASAGRGYNTNPQVTDAAVAAFSSPRVLTMMGWAAAAAASDPIGIRTAYGPNAPYRAVYQNGQWEKVGLRMANQADASGGATVDAEARTTINGLLAKLRAAGVMV